MLLDLVNKDGELAVQTKIITTVEEIISLDLLLLGKMTEKERDHAQALNPTHTLALKIVPINLRKATRTVIQERVAIVMATKREKARDRTPDRQLMKEVAIILDRLLVVWHPS
jgi:hypothetical protein